MSPIIGSFTSGRAFGRSGGGGGGAVSATGGTVTTFTENGISFTAHRFTSVGTNTFTVTSAPNNALVEVLLVGGGGGGGGAMGGGGGGGSVIHAFAPVTAQSYTIEVGGGGTADASNSCSNVFAGGSSTGFGITATGGGPGSPYTQTCTGGANGGGGSTNNTAGTSGTAPSLPGGIVGRVYAGYKGGGTSGGCWPCPNGGGAGAAGDGMYAQGTNYPSGDGGIGAFVNILGTGYYWGGGGGGCAYNQAYRGSPAPSRAGNGGMGGGGGGANDNTPSRAGGFGGVGAFNSGGNGGVAYNRSVPGGNGGANTGGGGGGAGWSQGDGGDGGSGIVIIKYPTTIPLLQNGTQSNPIRSAAALRGITSSGNYWIQTPSMTSATEYYVDASLNRGPWIRVFISGQDDQNYGSSVSWPDAQTPNLINNGNAFMYCFCNPNDNSVVQAWEWWFVYDPAEQYGAQGYLNRNSFRDFLPMSHGSDGAPLITKINAIRLSDNTRADGYWLRTGISSFGSSCDDGRSGRWGQICLKGGRGDAGQNGSASTGSGGFSDFPHYATYSVGGTDDCSQSNQTYSTTKCSSTRRFAIYVRI